MQLREFCGFRSGDKGNTADIALFAYDDAGYDLIVREVTAARVKAHFGSLVRGEVVRYEAANVRGLNFVLRGAPGGGGEEGGSTVNIASRPVARVAEPVPMPRSSTRSSGLMSMCSMARSMRLRTSRANVTS
jgi:hypothetical protein